MEKHTAVAPRCGRICCLSVKRNGELEPQLKPWREQLEPWGCKLKVFFDDTYCAGVYFLFLDAPKEW